MGRRTPDDIAGIETLHGVADLLARAELAASVAPAVGLGCIVALSNQTGSV